MGNAATAIMVFTAAVSLNPLEDVVFDRVDLIEVNHYYDEHGRLVFDQVIFYDWCDSSQRHQVRAWRLLKSSAQIPHRSWRRGEYTTVWKDGEVLREVTTSAVRETWTQYDPEHDERSFLPKDKRRELRKMTISRR